MRIIIINPKSDFTKAQIKSLKETGEVVFIEKDPDYNTKTFTDSREKVIALGPEAVDWKFTKLVIEKINNLQAICIPTTSYSWLDGKYMRDNDVVLTNVPKYSTESVAEYAISLMLNLAKKLPLVIKNNWKLDYDRHEGWEIKSKTMGVVGLGSIGTRIAELGKAMGMNVLYWSKNSRDKRFKYINLNQLLKRSDFIFPALAKNKETEDLLDSKKLDLMKDNSFLVSITGDDLFDLEYALKLLKSNKIAGIAFESDKYESNEMKFDDFAGNVMVTPPIAWFTNEAFQEDMRIWVETILSCVNKKPINVVN